MSTKSRGPPGPDYLERLAHFRNVDVEKNDMIKELIQNLENAKLDLENETTARRRLQDRVMEAEKLVTSQNGRDFVLVLIDADGDDYIFHDRYLDLSAAGGKSAADELSERVKDHVRSIGIDPTKTEIMVRAYANIKALHGYCIKSNKMKSGSNMSHFAHGFTQRQGLFDFVDVGDGKEGADHKIRESLEFFLDDQRCKQIIFGGCHDSGYAPFLGKFAADSSTRDRITLLLGSNPHHSIITLGFKNTFRLTSVFAPHNSGARSTQSPTPLPRIPPKAPAAAAVPAATPASANGQHPWINSAPKAERLGPRILDDQGKRVDKMLNVDVGSPYINFLRHSNLCAYFYLRGRCDGCQRNHLAPPLNPKEFDCLWYVSRQGLCYKARKGKVCDDDRCVYGHEDGFPVGSGRV